MTAPLDTDFQEKLEAAISGGASVTDSHLHVVERDLVVDGTKTTAHCYIPTLDGNGRLRIKLLVEFLRNRVVEYAVPPSKLQQAKKELNETGSPAALAKLHEEAKRSFTSLKTTGEGGEFLLFALAEKEFKLKQILCKMRLKTSSSMHYHGADGVYASGGEDGYFNLFWGESKVYADAKKAIKACLKSLAPFLTEELGEDAENARDILLLNEYSDLADGHLETVIKSFLSPDDPASKKLRLCGFALVGFDDEAFPSEGETADFNQIVSTIQGQLDNWKKYIGKRVEAENLKVFDIHFVCIPMRSVEDFRAYFLESLGVAK
ncbi:DUF1837 domain-containing protein [Pseudophaeobacter sp. EL27]|uniref:HamA C-terminal domain-containing protein n=1 Tax=Pseudophaeobacter sp. EL27 TaxID=2107580 RepID=UPI000EFC40BD|nr:DUF1837 domain-containing protein [Pseudophaeobacter sp. EL27]